MSRPPFQMKVDGGRLVPATAYDQERLDGFRRGSTVSVRLTADRMRPLERKYRAILGRVVKTCETPWSNAESAHQALKLACGYVNYGRTAGGNYMSWPRSITTFDDAELQDYFEQVMGLLFRMTGIDPETLDAESADTGDDEPEAAPRTRAASEGSDVPPDPETRASEAATDRQTASAVIPCAEDAAGGGAASPCDAPADPSTLKGQLVGSLRLECIHKMLMTATDDTISKDDRDVILRQARGWWTGKLPGETAFIRTVFDKAIQVSSSELPTPEALRYLRVLAAGKEKA